MRRAIRSFVLVSLVICEWQGGSQVRAQGVPLWTNRFNGLANGDDQPNALVVDSAGSVIVTGSSSGSGGLADFVTLKYSSAGTTLWTNRYDGPGNASDEAFAVTLGSTGSVLLTGRSEGTNGITDFATLAYSDLGVPLWTNRYNGPANQSDTASDVVVDKLGNVIVTGTSMGAGTFFDCATVKYSGSGVPQWTNGYNGKVFPPFDFANAAAVDGNGNVFIAGATTGAGASGSDFLTIAYSATGVPLWTNTFDGDNALAIKVDASNNIVVAGLSANGGTADPTVVKYSNSGTLLWSNALRGPIPAVSAALALDRSNNVVLSGFATNATGFDRQVAKYSPTGVPLWTNRFKGPEDFFSVQGNAVAVDSAGNVFATGSSTNGSGNYDFITVAYSSSGVPLWTNRYNGTGNGDDIADAVGVDTEGNVFVAGRSVGAGGNFDIVTLKYSASPPQIRLNVQRINSQVVVTWTNVGFSLQSAPTSTGNFTNVPGATSPYITTISGLQRFFRLRGN